MRKGTKNCDESLLGNVLDGRYELVRELGRGGAGVVYEANHLGIDMPVAVKVLGLKVSRERDAQERFQLESKTIGLLGHPSILRVRDSGTTPAGELYFVTDLLDGRSLGQVLRRSGQFTIADATATTICVLRALSSAHSVGVFHRDLKPENVFCADVLDEEGDSETVVKVLDFAMPDLVDARLEASSTTAKNTIITAPCYLAPDQLQVGRIDHRTDIYACGVLLYEMLTCRLPFEGDSFGDIIVAIMSGSPIPPRRYRPDIPIELEEVLLTAIARDKKDRFASALDFIEALEPFAGDHSCVEQEDGSSSERQRRHRDSLDSGEYVAPGPSRATVVLGVLGATTVAVLAGTAIGLGLECGAEGTPPAATVESHAVEQEESPPAPAIVEPVEREGMPSEADGEGSEVLSTTATRAEAVTERPTGGPQQPLPPPPPAWRRPAKAPSVPTKRPENDGSRFVTDIDGEPPQSSRGVVTDIDNSFP